MKIEKKLYKILKLSLRSLLYNHIGLIETKDYYSKMEAKKKKFTEIISKYLKGTEDFDESQDKNIFQESTMLGNELEKSFTEGKKIDETWVLLNIAKDSNQIAKSLILENSKQI